MGVTFNQVGFTIDVETTTDPIDAWLETQSQLIDVLQSEDMNMRSERFRYLELLRSMQPNLEVARRMFIKNTKT